MPARKNKITKRQQRAQHILATTAELVKRWGYKKTTIDDIAREAGVAKGTIYLHWRSREELFEALLANEMLTLITDFQERLLSSPTDTSLSALTVSALAISFKRPLVQSLLNGETDMLGNIIHTTAGQQLIQLRLRMGRAYLALLREHHMLRTNYDIDTQLKSLVAITTGFLTLNRFLPEELLFNAEELTTQLTETIHRTFEPETPPSPQDVQAVTHSLMQLLQQLKEAIQAQLDDE